MPFKKALKQRSSRRTFTGSSPTVEVLEDRTMLASAYAFTNTFGSYGSGNGQFYGPRGVAVDQSGNVFVADYNNSRIEEFSNSGTYLTQFGSLGYGNGQLDGPIGVAVDQSGNVFVSDFGNSR